MSLDVASQTSKLDDLYSVNTQNKSIYTVLQDLSNKSGLFFTYNSDILYEDSIVSVSYDSISLRNILDSLFSKDLYTFDVVDNHVIINELIEEKKIDPIEIEPFIFIEGKVYDRFSRKPLQFANISVYGKEIGTITNMYGEYILKIPTEYKSDTIAVSFVGYETELVPIQEFKSKVNRVYLKRQYIALQEVIIRNMQPITILNTSLEKIYDNYPSKPVLLNAFYREGVKRGNIYVMYSEAVFNIKKASYKSFLSTDQVRLYKSRKFIDYENIDTVLLKLKAGVNSTLRLDFIKYPLSFISPDHFSKYHYRMTDITRYDTSMVYVIEFKQYDFIDEPFYEGKLYIDVNTLAILGADFSINQKRINKAATLFVVKKTRKLDVKPVYARYKVEYKPYFGKYYINYVRGDLKFKIRSKEKLFANTFETFIEMAVSEIDTLNVKKFKNKELLRTRDIFLENVSEYDVDFWEDFNFIPPETPIRNAIRNLPPIISD